MILLQSASGGTSLIFFGLIFAVMYFFMIRPQMKKQKKEASFREALQIGEKVVTIGGIHGKISELGKTTVVLEIHNSGKLKVERSAISMLAQTEIQQN
ncbi:MAG: preprotein translocase subunit YajC [Flavobacteriales bacterium]|nr:preprotein translocase subunit YajC [Flavobacteriales bacterium]